MTDLKAHIRILPDHPKPGILFYDIGTLLAHGGAWKTTIDRIATKLKPLHPDKLIGIESRGFLVSAAVAAQLGIGLAMIRKRGKLPGRVLSRSYALEYGEDVIEMQEGILNAGERVVLCDDLLATGGTAEAALGLVRQAGGEIIHAAFVIELENLNGRARLDVPISSLVQF